MVEGFFTLLTFADSIASLASPFCGVQLPDLVPLQGRHFRSPSVFIMATMATSNKTRSVAALLLLVAVLVGTCATGAHATNDSVALQTSIQNFCPENVTAVFGVNVAVPILNIPLTPGGITIVNVTVGANGTTSLLPFLLNLVSNYVGIALSFVGTPGLITVPVVTLENELLASITGLFGGLGGIVAEIIENVSPQLITNIAINCSDTTCGSTGLAVANTSVTVTSIFNITAKVCV